MFRILRKNGNILCRQQMLRARANRETSVSATKFLQQCFPVCHRLNTSAMKCGHRLYQIALHSSVNQLFYFLNFRLNQQDAGMYQNFLSEMPTVAFEVSRVPPNLLAAGPKRADFDWGAYERRKLEPLIAEFTANILLHSLTPDGDDRSLFH